MNYTSSPNKRSVRPTNFSGRRRTVPAGGNEGCPSPRQEGPAGATLATTQAQAPAGGVSAPQERRPGRQSRHRTLYLFFVIAAFSPIMWDDVWNLAPWLVILIAIGTFFSIMAWILGSLLMGPRTKY